MAYLGNTPTTQNFVSGTDYFNGTGSQTAFTLSRTVGSINDIQVTVNNVVQQPNDAYTLSGTTLTMTSAPSSGTNNVYVRYLSTTTQVITPSQNTVGTAQLGTITNIASGNSSLTLQTGSSPTTAVTIDTSQNVGIGTSSPSEKLEINNGNLAVGNAGSNFTMKVSRTGANASSVVVGAFTNEPDIQWTYTGSGALRFTDSTASAERMRIDSSGNLLVGTTTTNGLITGIQASTSAYAGYFTSNYTASNNANIMLWGRSGGAVAAAVRYKDASTSLEFYSPTGHTVAYTTSSDYRLKENVTPMMGALATVAQLKPITYTWKNGFGIGNGEGFIAHELQAVVPNCVTGEKDAVETYIDENGNEQTRPVYQGVDTSFLVATLTAAIQELNAKVDAQAVRIAELEGVA